jgi:ligand-binding sensor domain-containing protein
VKRFIIILFFPILSVWINAQSVVGEWDSYTSVLNVRDIIVRDNYIYGASCGGLVEFDKSTQQFEKYTIRDGLTRNDIQCIAEDNLSRLWLGMSSPNGEINIWNRETKNIEQVFTENVFGDKLTCITSIAFHGDTAFAAYQLNVDWGIAYFKASGTKYNYRDRFESFPTEISGINSLAVIGDTLWVATNSGLLFANLNQVDLKPKTAWQTVHFPSIGSVSNIVDYQGKILANLGSALFEIQGDRATLYNDSFTRDIKSIVTDNLGALYITTNRDVYKYNSGIWQLIISGYITKCTFDTDNTLWGGSEYKSIWSYSENRLQYFTPNTILDNIYTALWVGDDGTLMAGTKKGISVLTNRGWYNIHGLKNDIRIHANYDWDWDRFVADTIAYSLSERIYNIVRRKDGHFFASLYGSTQLGLRPGGLLEFELDNLANYTVYDTTGQKLAASAGRGGSDYYLKVGTIALDQHDNLWIANTNAQNDSSIAVLSFDNRWIHFGIGESNNHLNYHPVSITFDDRGRVWIASEVHSGSTPAPSAGGIAVLDYKGTLFDKSDDSWYWIATSAGLGDNSVYSIAFDLDGDLWIMTAAGIQRATVSENFPNSFFSQIDSPVLSNVPFAKECKIKVDGLNNKWITSVGSGVKVYTHNGSWLNNVEGFTVNNSQILSNTVLDIAFNNAEGLVYLATTKGISIYKSPYAVFGNEYRELKIFPMPYEIPSIRPLIIDGLLQESDVKIMTIDGTFIKYLSYIDGDVVGQQAFWDGKDHRGRYVGSGVYLCMAYTKDGDTTVGKIAVIRK